jgi:hypothetical protein
MSKAQPSMWLTPQEVGVMVGFSAQFIRMEIKANALPAQLIVSQRGRLGRYRIHQDDAIAYAIRLGVWRSSPAPSPPHG